MRIKTALIWVAGALLVVVGGAASWIAVKMDKPWREGIQDIGGDCTRSFTASPVTAHGATITVDASPESCGYGFAVQRDISRVAHYMLEVNKGALQAGEMQVSVTAYDGHRKLDRNFRTLEAPEDLSGLSLPIDVPASTRLIEMRFVGRKGARFAVEGVRLVPRENLAQPGITGVVLYDEAMEVIQSNAFNADQLPSDFRERWRPAADATPGEARSAIKQVLRALGDRHSFLIDPARQADMPHVARATFVAPQWEMLEPGIGYIAIPGIQAGDRALRDRYRDAVLDALRAGHAQGVRGWLVDLRGNGGGIMWPMLAGLEPLLRGQTTGYFLRTDGSRDAWPNNTTAASADAPDLGQLPVAVLTSGRTASSGEAVVMAFRGRANTRSFGAPTKGVPTANAGHRLADGTILQLTGALFVDRNGKGDGTSVVPDESVRELGVGDRTRQAAVEWLRQQR
ncbi:S41 family peptidase [Stenotrophomonas sp. PS02289]|uniref:S41 family peptidase n=1 Tax=Stenotrophomonas sp. PS02289 TaxID=2991422 RepID=UPI002499D233|nr:S41 family peptidase [Stenotrophomonas sp. PS02289]